MPRERSDRWNKLDAPLLAARQHGAIKGSQLGLSRATISRWVDEGRLYRKYRGVYAYGHPHLAREGRWMAAVLAAGDGAALTGMIVALVWELTRQEPREIEVLAPKRRHVPGVRVRECRNLDPRDMTEWRGIPVTTVARMLVDLTDDEPADVLANLIHEAAYRNRFSLDATHAAMARAKGRHNLAVLHEALRMHAAGSAGSRSRLERRFRRLVVGAGFPEPVQNTIANGFEVDAYWPGLCVEIDGPNHTRARTKVDDRIRDAALRAAGFTVLRFREADVDQRPDWVLGQLAPHTTSP